MSGGQDVEPSRPASHGPVVDHSSVFSIVQMRAFARRKRKGEGEKNETCSIISAAFLYGRNAVVDFLIHGTV